VQLRLWVFYWYADWRSRTTQLDLGAKELYEEGSNLTSVSEHL
jgi:hypothetical protein